MRPTVLNYGQNSSKSTLLRRPDLDCAIAKLRRSTQDSPTHHHHRKLALPMKLHHFIAILLALTLGCTPRTPPSAGVPRDVARPNILVIMADDHGAPAISAYGSRINHTPNIDRLAREGTRFIN